MCYPYISVGFYLLVKTHAHFPTLLGMTVLCGNETEPLCFSCVVPFWATHFLFFRKMPGENKNEREVRENEKDKDKEEEEQ